MSKDLDESNYREMAQDCVKQHAEDGLLIASIIWGRIIGFYEAAITKPVPMFLTCPKCNARHIDEGEFATKPHHTHACQACGLTWRPAVLNTVGVKFLPGFKDMSVTPEEVQSRIVGWLRAGKASETFHEMRMACDIAKKIERGEWQEEGGPDEQ